MPTVPTIIRVVDKNGVQSDANTLPAVGAKAPDSSLPIAMALGVIPVQTFVSIPKLDTTSGTTLLATSIQVLAANPNRRYLKIVNNGPFDVELWIVRPTGANVGQALPRGEVLLAQGFGIMETDTCRASAIFATCVGGVSGLMVLEG